MNKTVIALTTALLLAGGAASTASAQTTYYYTNGTTYVDRDVDRDGIPNQWDPYNNRRSYEQYTYDRYGRRVMIALDRDCDGVADRYDRYIRRDLNDADCDGIPNRVDTYYNRNTSPQRYYRTTRYVAPGHSRYRVGSYLPVGYYGESYYVDYDTYGLTPPPYGYRWNRVGNDVYLVSTDNGLIAQVIYDLFH